MQFIKCCEWSVHDESTCIIHEAKQIDLHSQANARKQARRSSNRNPQLTCNDIFDLSIDVVSVIIKSSLRIHIILILCRRVKITTGRGGKCSSLTWLSYRRLPAPFSSERDRRRSRNRGHGGWTSARTQSGILLYVNDGRTGIRLGRGRKGIGNTRDNKTEGKWERHCNSDSSVVYNSQLLNSTYKSRLKWLQRDSWEYIVL